MFPFLIICSANSTFFTEPNLLKKLNLSDTKFCESILSPTEFTWKRSFEATFDNVKNGGFLYESDRIDSCCRSFHKCEAHKHIELKNITEQANIRHCECEYSFKNCLENLNTSSSNVLGFIHSLNAEKCYAIDHPIVKCISSDAPLMEPEIDLHFKDLNTVKRKSIFNRCSKYDLDQGQPQLLQMFDVPFNERAAFAFKCKLWTEICFLLFVSCLSKYVWEKHKQNQNMPHISTKYFCNSAVCESHENMHGFVFHVLSIIQYKLLKHM